MIVSDILLVVPELDSLELLTCYLFSMQHSSSHCTKLALPQPPMTTSAVAEVRNPPVTVCMPPASCMLTCKRSSGNTLRYTAL